MKKTLTISIAAYNAEKWIGRCLDSFIIPEIISDIEIIVVNDGSADQTSNIAHSYARKYPASIMVIDKENGGHGSTINTAIKAAQGQYFKVVDSDDWVEKEGLVQLVTRLKRVNVDLDISPYYFVDAENGKKKLANCVDNMNIGQINTVIALNESGSATYNLAMHGLTFRTSLLKEHFTQINENCFYVDLEYIVFYFCHVKSIFVSDVPVYDYLIGTNEQSVNMTNMIKRRNQHLLVCERIVMFYAGLPGQASSVNRNIIKKVVESCIINEYRILLEIDNFRQSKTELLAFDRHLKELDASIYKNTISNGIKAKKETAIIIGVLRMIRFRGYRIFHLLLKKMQGNKAYK